MSDESGRPNRSASTGRKAGAPVSGAEFAGVGLQFAITIVAFTFFGIWLDKRLGSSPWFVIVCVFAGAAGGFYSIYRKLMAGQRRPDRTHE